MPYRLSGEEQATAVELVDWLFLQSGCASLAEFAEQSGVSAPNLSNWRNGKRQITGPNLLRLIRASGVLTSSHARSADELARSVEILRAEIALVRERLAPIEDDQEAGKGASDTLATLQELRFLLNRRDDTLTQLQIENERTGVKIDELTRSFNRLAAELRSHLVVH